MKKTLVILTLIVVFLSNINAQIRPMPIKRPVNVDYNQVTFYENTNYGGKGYRLGRGSYTLQELGMAANDFFSSAVIPSNLVVMVFESDNYLGNFYILQTDNASNQPNRDFTKVNIAVGKDTEGRQLSGIKDLNDMISSIIIFDPKYDKVSLYENCESGGFSSYDKETAIYPGPLPNSQLMRFFNYTNGIWGWNDLGELAFTNDKTSGLYFYPGHNVASAYIFTDVNFRGMVNVLNNNVPCFRNLKYSNVADGIFSSDWNDRTSSVYARMARGRVEILN